MASGGCRNRFEVGSAKVLSFIKGIGGASDDGDRLRFEQTEEKRVRFTGKNVLEVGQGKCLSLVWG